ncbi:MAG: hypothetical protein WAN77_09090 [Thermoplasmata archaeon]
MPEFRGVSLGILEPISMRELAPGALGWHCEIRLSATGTNSTLYLVLSPRGTKAESSLTGVHPKEIAYRHALDGEVGVELLVRSSAARDLPRLRSVADAIRVELEAE